MKVEVSGEVGERVHVHRWMIGWIDGWVDGRAHHGSACRCAEDGERRDAQPVVGRAEARAVEREGLRCRLPMTHEQLEPTVSVEVAHRAARAVARRLEGVANVDLGPVGIGR